MAGKGYDLRKLFAILYEEISRAGEVILVSSTRQDEVSQVTAPRAVFSGGLLLRFIGSLFVLLAVLLLADVWCYQQSLPVAFDVQSGQARLTVGSEVLPLGSIRTPTSLQLLPYDPVIHEYQLDGTDSANNFTLDTTYLHTIENSPYYRFQAWMRNLQGTNRWSDLHIYMGSQLVKNIDWPGNGATIALPSTSVQNAPPLHIQLALRRPETAVTFNLVMNDGATIQVTLDRNNRKIDVVRNFQGSSLELAKTFFPINVLPFAAMVADTILRTLICAVLILLVVMCCDSCLAFVLFPALRAVKIQSVRSLQGSYKQWRAMTNSLYAPVYLVLLASFVFVCWIARVQYNAEPHIYDASAYLFAAKMYATGHLSVPLPPAIDRFPGPFMNQFAGRWFGQYAPGTALTLVPGVWLGVPWLVEPLLGTFALLGTGLLAARLYNRRVASLAVVLGALSPFYSYLAASYLSHAIAFFYLVWGVWALVRFAQGEAAWNLPLAAFFFGMAALTRDLVTVLYVAVVLAGVLLLAWRYWHTALRRWWRPGLAFAFIAFLFLCLSLDFNVLLTHSLWLTPRALFFAGDRWGFGPGVGFYGQHTLAAGLVNLDELLTSLQIDLFGWPFYFTLAFIALPFITRKANAIDWFLLACLVILVGAYIGYFYHGIYLGPRYLFETLPFLLLLTARGIFALAESSIALAGWLRPRRQSGAAPRGGFSVATFVLVIALLLCNLLYYMPRQLTLYNNYSGLPAGYHVDLSAIYHPPMHNAIVVTSDYTIYQFVLFPLNDPYLHDSVTYAFATTDADYNELRAAFPGRQLYTLEIAPDGSVQYTRF